MSEMWHVKTLYTIYREPGHRKVIDHGCAEECLRWFRKHDPNMVPPRGWTSLYMTLKNGKNRRYSMERTARKDWTQKPKARADWRDEPMVQLCGSCAYWTKEKERAKDGRRYGMCSRLEARTERCAACRMGEK